VNVPSLALLLSFRHLGVLTHTGRNWRAFLTFALRLHQKKMLFF
jgi:hypothetical protein